MHLQGHIHTSVHIAMLSLVVHFRSLILKRCIRRDIQGEKERDQIVTSKCAYSVCSCEELGYLHTLGENVPTGKLEGKHVPDDGQIKPRTTDTWRVG